MLAVNEYQKLAQRTSNKDLTKGEHLMNGALGLTGEAGEVADLIKKGLFQGHHISYGDVAKELGDVLWYVVETATAIGYSLEAIMRMNIEKLEARYPDGFDADKSLHRKEGDT